MLSNFFVASGNAKPRQQEQCRNLAVVSAVLRCGPRVEMIAQLRDDQVKMFCSFQNFFVFGLSFIFNLLF